MKKFLCFVLALALACCVTAQADDATSTNKVNDPAFDMYVNADTLDLARKTAEASLILDVAMQLAEGEKVLLRSHRACSADDMLKMAAKVAAVKGDEETQARLKKAVEKLGKGDLVAEFDSIAKLAGASRNAEKPKFSTGDDKALATTVEELVSAIDDAVLLHNVAELRKIEQWMSQVAFSEKLSSEISDYIGKALGDPAFSKLSGESRQFGGGSGGGFGGSSNASQNQYSPGNSGQTTGYRRVVMDPNAGGMGGGGTGSGVAGMVRVDPNAGGMGGGGTGGGVAYRTYVDPNAGGGMGGAPFYSSRLRAEFVVVPSGGRSITSLRWGSPLQKAGLEVGDIIVRMDGIPVHSDWELDNHYGPTIIDVIDWRTNRIVRRNAWIP